MPACPVAADASARGGSFPVSQENLTMSSCLSWTACRPYVPACVAAILAVARIAGGVASAAEPVEAPIATTVETAEDAVVLPPAGAIVAEQEMPEVSLPAASDPPAAKDEARKAGSRPRPGKESERGKDSASDDDAAKLCRGMIPVCRRVPLKVKKPHVEYSMKCELVCVPGCGCLAHGGQHGHCRHCADGGGGCGDVRVRQKKLLLKEVTEKEHESYEYKIAWVCPACAGFGGRCAAATCTDHSASRATSAARAVPPTPSDARKPGDASHRSPEPRFADRLLEWLPPLR
jgi:hypothetical protein